MPRLRAGRGGGHRPAAGGDVPLRQRGRVQLGARDHHRPARAELRHRVHRVVARGLQADPLQAAAQPGARRDPLPQRAADAAQAGVQPEEAARLRSAGEAARRVPQAGRGHQRGAARGGGQDRDDGRHRLARLPAQRRDLAPDLRQLPQVLHLALVRRLLLDRAHDARAAVQDGRDRRGGAAVQGAALGVHRVRGLPGVDAAAAAALPVHPDRTRHLHQGTQDRPGQRRVDQGRPGGAVVRPGGGSHLRPPVVGAVLRGHRAAGLRRRRPHHLAVRGQPVAAGGGRGAAGAHPGDPQRHRPEPVHPDRPEARARRCHTCWA